MPKQKPLSFLLLTIVAKAIVGTIKLGSRLRRMIGWPRRLDLTQDGPKIVSMLKIGLAKFLASPEGKKALPITIVAFKYDLTTEFLPRIWFELDTEPNGEPFSGSSQTHEIASSECKRWAGPCFGVLDGDKVVVVVPGRSTVVTDETGLYQAVGLYFVDLMKQMRDGGMFKSLRRGPKCHIVVSAEDGTWGWPEWEDRGKEDLV